MRLFGIAKARDPTTCVEVCEFMDGNNIANRRVEICCLPTIKKVDFVTRYQTTKITNSKTYKFKVKIAHNIATGLHYLHSRNIVHGDLHTYNILVSVSGCCTTQQKQVVLTKLASWTMSWLQNWRIFNCHMKQTRRIPPLLSIGHRPRLKCCKGRRPLFSQVSSKLLFVSIFC